MHVQKLIIIKKTNDYLMNDSPPENLHELGKIVVKVVESGGHVSEDRTV